MKNTIQKFPLDPIVVELILYLTTFIAARQLWPNIYKKNNMAIDRCFSFIVSMLLIYIILVCAKKNIYMYKVMMKTTLIFFFVNCFSLLCLILNKIVILWLFQCAKMTTSIFEIIIKIKIKTWLAFFVMVKANNLHPRISFCCNSISFKCKWNFVI